MKNLYILVPILLFILSIYVLWNTENAINNSEPTVVTLDSLITIDSISYVKDNIEMTVDTLNTVVNLAYKYQVLQPNFYEKEFQGVIDLAYKILFLSSGLFVVLLILPRLSTLKLSANSLELSLIDAITESANTVQEAADKIISNKGLAKESANPDSSLADEQFDRLKKSNEKLKDYLELFDRSVRKRK